MAKKRLQRTDDKSSGERKLEERGGKPRDVERREEEGRRLGEGRQKGDT